MKILGIDPGIATIGIGVLQKDDAGSVVLLDACTIETDAGLTLSERLQELADDLSEIIQEYQPTVAVVEKLYFETNRKTAIDVAQARGVILLALQNAKVPLLQPTPLELKSAVTGDGHADKQQMADMLMRMFGDELKGAKDDAIDAVGLAVFGAAAYQEAFV